MKFVNGGFFKMYNHSYMFQRLHIITMYKLIIPIFILCSLSNKCYTQIQACVVEQGQFVPNIDNNLSIFLDEFLVSADGNGCWISNFNKQ